MAKFYGIIGYEIMNETAPSVYKSSFIERQYKGDIIKISSKWQQTDKVNDDISINNRISVVADPFAIQHFPFIRYVQFLNTAWSVTHIDVEYPRIILTLGGVYNGQQAKS